MTLSELKRGERALLLNFQGPIELVERLHELGLHKGMEISLLQRSPFKGPLIYSISNTLIALREVEAECIVIQKYS